MLAFLREILARLFLKIKIRDHGSSYGVNPWLKFCGYYLATIAFEFNATLAFVTIIIGSLSQRK
jgi:hypothetical protein